MSNYIEPTRHPETGEVENAEWLDNAFGRHLYGVRFPSDGIIRDARDLKCEPEDIVALLQNRTLGWSINSDKARISMRLGDVRAALVEIERLRLHSKALEGQLDRMIGRHEKQKNEIERLRRVLRQWESYGCPICGGDCNGANPQIGGCVMRETYAALEGEKNDG